MADHVKPVSSVRDGGRLGKSFRPDTTGTLQEEGDAGLINLAGERVTPNWNIDTFNGDPFWPGSSPHQGTHGVLGRCCGALAGMMLLKRANKSCWGIKGSILMLIPPGRRGGVF